MRYEKKNNLGLLLLIVGGLLVIFMLFFLQFNGLGYATLALALVLILAGAYLMTRTFTEADVNHPDYQRWQDRLKK